MTLTADSPQALARFDSIMATLATKGRGITMVDLGIAHALARALDSKVRDDGKIEDMRAGLGLIEDEIR